MKAPGGMKRVKSSATQTVFLQNQRNIFKKRFEKKYGQFQEYLPDAQTSDFNVWHAIGAAPSASRAVTLPSEQGSLCTEQAPLPSAAATRAGCRAVTSSSPHALPAPRAPHAGI